VLEERQPCASRPRDRGAMATYSVIATDNVEHSPPGNNLRDIAQLDALFALARGPQLHLQALDQAGVHFSTASQLT